MTTPATDSLDPPGDFFRQLADGAPVMIWMSGLDLGCFYFNRAWLDFRGRTLEQEAGNGWAEGVHPDDLERCVNHYVACFERRLAFAMSYRLQHHSGAYRWILDRGVPHFLPDRTFLGFFGGCAEIGNDAQISRHAELGTTIGTMRGYARQIATEGVPALRALTSTTEVPILTATKSILHIHADREARLRHATEEMERLARDMDTFGNLAQGACLPQLAAAMPEALR